MEKRWAPSYQEQEGETLAHVSLKGIQGQDAQDSLG